MAATGYTPIYLYYSSTATNAPSAGNLGYGELALNITDKNLFFKDNTNTVNTVPIRQSSTSSNGWLSSTDWNTFNNKQPAGTYVTSVSGTAPVVSSGGTTPAISMAAATGSVNGYLTSTDWTTFNGKQAALVSGTNIKTVSGTTLLGSGDLGTIGTGYGGTGLTSFTANGVVYASSTSALTTGSGLTFDGSTLTVSTSGSTFLNLTSSSTAAGGNGPVLGLSNAGYIARSGRLFGDTTNNLLISSRTTSSVDGAILFGIGDSYSEAMRIFASKGISIGNTTDPGATNLSVSGKIIVNGAPTTSQLTIKQSANGYGGGYSIVSQSNTNYWSHCVASTNDLYYGYNNADKGYFSNSTGAYSAVSDERLKKNISDISYGLDDVLKLRPVEYLMNEEEEGLQKHLGFIAQETQQVIPSAVSEMISGMLGMDKGEIIPVLVKAIQQLTARITVLENK